MEKVLWIYIGDMRQAMNFFSQLVSNVRETTLLSKKRIRTTQIRLLIQHLATFLPVYQ